MAIKEEDSLGSVVDAKKNQTASTSRPKKKPRMANKMNILCYKLQVLMKRKNVEELWPEGAEYLLIGEQIN